MQRIIIAFLLVWALAATSLSAYLLTTTPPAAEAQAKPSEMVPIMTEEMTADHMCRQMQEVARPHFVFPGGVEYPTCGEFGAEPRQDENGEWFMFGQATIDALNGPTTHSYSVWAWPTADGWEYQVHVID